MKDTPAVNGVSPGPSKGLGAFHGPAEAAFKDALSDGRISESALLFLGEEQLLAVFELGYRAGLLSASKTTPGLNPALAMRNEAAEQFVIECVRPAADGASTKVPNAALTAAFSAWLAKRWPEQAALIESKSCARALHRAMDSRGVGRRPVHGSAAAARHDVQLLPGVALDAALASQDGSGSLSWTERLALPVSLWVDDHVLAWRDPYESGALHLANGKIAHAFTSAMSGRHPFVTEASQHAIMRAINKRLDEEGVGEPSRNAAGFGRRGLYIVPDGKTIAELIDEKGRDWVERLFVLREH